MDGQGLLPLVRIGQSVRLEDILKIEINQTSPATWGRLGIKETKLAAERLSGESFKSWVLLALNQDGYAWSGDMERRTFQELSNYGYPTPLQGGNYLFRPDGEPEDCDIPAGWEKIVSLYGSCGQQDLSWVQNKLQSVCLDDRIEDIIAYWSEKYHSLQELDHSKARNHHKFDFAVLLVWWLWDNFRFQSGDVLEIGEGARLLRFHDNAFKSKIQTGVRDRKITKIHMTDAAANIWNTAFSAKKVEIPLDIVGNILRLRQVS